jgi:hypothetical protein
MRSLHSEGNETGRKVLAFCIQDLRNSVSAEVVYKHENIFPAAKSKD